MSFGGLETGLKFHDFGFRGGPELRAHCQFVVFACSLVPIPTTKQSGVTLQHAKYSIKPAGRKGYENTRMQLRKYEKSKLQYDHVTTGEAGYRIEEILRSL